MSALKQSAKRIRQNKIHYVEIAVIDYTTRGPCRAGVNRELYCHATAIHTEDNQIIVCMIPIATASAVSHSSLNALTPSVTGTESNNYLIF